jgi:hypothetical protein
VLIACLVSTSTSLRAQEIGNSAIEQLLEIVSADASVQARIVRELPIHLQGQLIALAEYDDKSQEWRPMDRPQDFGSVTTDRINVLGYDVGQDGFVEAQYIEITDRRMISYTGVTMDRRLSVNLYDDENDSDHLVLQVRIGPRQLRYLLQRPGLSN